MNLRPGIAVQSRAKGLWLFSAARASAAAWGGAISWLACAEARVLTLCSPETELGFCFRIGICGVF